MEFSEIKIEKADVHKLLCAANPDAALLYLYLSCGNRLEKAGEDLQINDSRIQLAAASLRQLGLWQEKKPVIMMGERPNYSATDVLLASDTDNEFRMICHEVEHQLGRPLNTEELKILLGFVRYLGLPGDVICLLVNHCKERLRWKGSTRNPSLRSVEKEAYIWVDKGIDTMEEAIAYIQRQTMRNSRMGKLLQILQIQGRSLTAAEERYAQQWLDWGFDDGALAMAYERTCLNTGGLRWPYMNKILSSWQQAGVITAEAIQNADHKPIPKGATGQLGTAEMEAIHKMMQEG